MGEDSDGDGNENKGARRATELNLDEVVERLKLPQGAVAKHQEAMERLIAPTRDLAERMKNLGVSAGEASVIGRLSRQIADQQRAIDAIPLPPRIPNIKPLPNPIHETNKHLGQIEARFEQMQVIATDAAQIATGLQAAAAELLQKFEKAASDNDRTAGRAIKIGIFALLIAIGTTAAQIGYSEYRREPNNGIEIQRTLEGIRSELVSTREAQAAATDLIEKKLKSSDSDSAAVLKDIRDLLSREPASPVSPPKGPAQ